MIKKLLRPKVFLALLVLLIVFSAFFALAGANTVPATHIEDHTGPTPSPNDLKPPECNPIFVDEITAGSGVINGTRTNNLILGSSGSDTIYVAKGGDNTLTNCIVAGAGDDYIEGSKKVDIILGGEGNDEIYGRRGNDVIYGGPGDDYIDGGRDYDICYGGGGNDTFVRCEETY